MVLSSVATWARRNLPHGDGLPEVLGGRRHRTVLGVLRCALVGPVVVGRALGPLPAGRTGGAG